jgi:hypothetical protein
MFRFPQAAGPRATASSAYFNATLNNRNQGRPVNSNREAACFIAKLGGNEIHAEIAKSGGRTLCEVFV